MPLAYLGLYQPFDDPHPASPCQPPAYLGLYLQVVAVDLEAPCQPLAYQGRTSYPLDPSQKYPLIAPP